MNSGGDGHMVEAFSEYELRLIHKIAVMNRWCPHKHISKEDLLKGTLRSDWNLYETALENLLNREILGSKKAQNRHDVCLNKKKRQIVISTLRENIGRYDFITSFSVGRIK